MNYLCGKIVLVTGGTGFIGTALCKELTSHGAKLFVLTRQSLESSPNIIFISSLDQIKTEKLDIIINLAGEPIAQRWTSARKQKIQNSRICTTSSIIDFIKTSSSKPSLLINASAIGYYGTDENTEFTENTAPVNQSLFSHQLCKAWELEANQAQQYGVRTVLLRIGVVLEKEGGMLAKLLPAFRLGLGGPIGSGRQWLSWIHREDLVRLVLHIINTPSLEGPLNATAPNPVSNLEFSTTLAKTVHRPCFMRTPAFMLRLLFGQMATELMLEGQKVLPHKALQSGFVFDYPTLRLALKKILNKMSS